jgi:RNA polymerase sigma-70 factor (ECF subfamily)
MTVARIAILGGLMELIQRIAEPLDLADTPLDDRLAVEARSDAQAFAPLYERHLERVYRYLRARGASEDDAAELAALTFERALSHIAQYRPGGSGFGPWLLRIARNAFIDAVRRRHNRSLDSQEVAGLTAPDQSPEEAAIAAEERRRILSLVARLPDVQRDALALRYAGGLSSREIAPLIGKSEAATKKLLTRSLAALKEAIRNGA